VSAPPAFIALLAVAVALSVVTFAVYGLDKRAARAGAWRTRESVLHLMALLGGWPGALMAQRIFRHKTKKRSFQVVFWLTVAVNVSATSWLVAALLE
jgi:uncharacterized membrane protein YsdA (DUF1294 family)